MTSPPLRILVIDDNPGDRRLVEVELAFRSGGDRFSMHGAATLAEGLAAVAAEEEGFDAVFLDMGLPDSQGLDTVRQFIDAAPDMPVVVLTGLDDRDTGIAAVRAGAQDYLVKGDVRGDLLERSLMHAMERKKAEEKLRESEARLHSILQDSPVGVAMTRHDGSILFLNPRLAEMHGVDPDTFRTRKAVSFYADPADRERLVSAVRAGRPPRDVEVRFRRADGVFYWALVTMVETRHEDEPVLLTWLYDISARKAAEEAQRAAAEQAERAAQSRTEFLAMVSHEIRTPMTGVLGMVRLLLHSTLTAEQRDCVETIAYSGDALMSILDDVLDLTRLDAGRLEIAEGDFDPRRVVHSVVHLMASRATEKGLRLDTEIDPAVPDTVRGDAARIRQVLLNLIGNAIKFTERGGVTVAMARQADGGLRFEVRDTGPGIALDRRGTLFEPFTQADPLVAAHHGGSGLGLSICRRLARLMGGDIGVGGEPGAGSVFWFTVALRPAAAAGAAADAPPEAPEAAPRRGLSILLAEDNPINQKVVTGFLTHQGHRVELAANGAEAVAAAARGVFDVVLMDVHMPVLDGLRAAAAIRALPGPQARVPILALTADVFPEDVARCRRAGMDGHLAKPVQPEHLAAALARACGGAPPTEAAGPRGAAGDLQALDPRAVESLAGQLDAGFLASLAAAFRAEAERDVAQLAAPHAVLTDPVLRRRAHDLKATAGNFGLALLSAAAEQVEMLAREGRLEDARAAARPLPALLRDGLGALARRFPMLRIPLPDTARVE
ncbi:response regulator [Novispirillum sp. DQ9]|uniref:hybrid sensor histidine kinase/response regulator n=1 Tax=Novispirillum sp. DQ9 TaxID=3398612 RepID=UPI003C7B11E9